MKELFDNPLFYVLITIVAYEFGLFVYRKTKVSVLNPYLISVILIILFLSKANISIESYSKGGDLISFFLAPATVILAVPLYKQLNLLKANILPIVVGVFAGSITAIVSVCVLSKLMKLPLPISLSLVPKSITTPIGIELSKQIKGIPSVTVATIIITGIFGAVFGPFICKLFRISDKIAVGIAFGTSSHVIGTTKAVELGEVEGAMSSLSIGIAGVITVLIAPLILKFLF
ncbi:MAG TPA: LrgB family protein [Clostridiaceae bacterium]|nr:LrgB family protein [Clostridiaceae bacterium]